MVRSPSTTSFGIELLHGATNVALAASGDCQVRT